MHTLDLIRSRFATALEGLVDNATEHARRVQSAREPKFGDYQANLAMGLAKQLGRDANEMAQQVIDSVKLDDICERIEIAGKGFINLRLRNAWLAQQIEAIALDPRVGVSIVREPRTFVVDHSSPNVAKPLHVGHIRSMVIGDALARILRFIGHNVVTDNHLGDWGTQFGMVIYGYKHFVDPIAFRQAAVQELSRLYRIVQQLIEYQSAKALLSTQQADLELAVSRAATLQRALPTQGSDKKNDKALKIAERAIEDAQQAIDASLRKIEVVDADPQLSQWASQHPDMDRRALDETAKLHAGDESNRQLWAQFVPLCVADIHKIYDRLQITFDYEYGESYYHAMLQGVVDDLVRRGFAKLSDGALCVFLDDYDAPMIIRKKDGAFLYATTDLATVDYRMEHFHPDAILYVVDHRQSEHFNKLFATLRTIGYRDVEFRHISFGTVLGKDGKPFKTRSGTVVDLESLLDEAVQRAWQVVCDPSRLNAASLAMDDAEMRNIAQVVGLGAIKYADLAHNRTSDYVFDIDKMVQLDGNTATYIQYSYARAMSILRRAEVDINPQWLASIHILLGQPAERDLAIQLVRFEEYLHQSMDEYFPNILANYLYDLAKTFASFFDLCPVLKADSEEVAQSRQGLVYITSQILKKGLELLGIGVVQRM